MKDYENRNRDYLLETIKEAFGTQLKRKPYIRLLPSATTGQDYLFIVTLKSDYDNPLDFQGPLDWLMLEWNRGDDAYSLEVHQGNYELILMIYINE
jgi:hypothetical protein